MYHSVDEHETDSLDSVCGRHELVYAGNIMIGYDVI